MNFCEVVQSYWAALRAIIVTLYHSIFGLSKAYLNGAEYPEESVQAWSRSILKIAKIDLDIQGFENIPDTGALFLVNHKSLLDIPIIHVSLQKKVRFGAKIELYSIPFFGSAIKKAGALPIARTNLGAVQKVYEGAKIRIANGESFVLAPEGTRYPSEGIGPFKSGPFVLAINAEAPIVPVVIKGVDRILSKKSGRLKVSKANKILVRILPAIETEGMDLSQRKNLLDEVRSQFVKVYDEI